VPAVPSVLAQAEQLLPPLLAVAPRRPGALRAEPEALRLAMTAELSVAPWQEEVVPGSRSSPEALR
jgi:hypothetical protein